MLVYHGPSHQGSKEKIQAMEMRCYRKILHSSYKDHVTDEEVRAEIQQAIGPREDLTIVKRCKLQWYVSHSSGLAITILQGTVKEGRRQGRQRKRWEDIRDWTGLEFGKSQRAVENREKKEKTGCKIICGAPTIVAVKGLLMIMMILQKLRAVSTYPSPQSLSLIHI